MVLSSIKSPTLLIELSTASPALLAADFALSTVVFSVSAEAFNAAKPKKSASNILAFFSLVIVMSSFFHQRWRLIAVNYASIFKNTN
ncbi:hypothetical protein UUU_04420 [Klebsiella pneumoniae subsp. pneumoniae DSM 30104 = JCM 1662 = NBRC 14940]|nr:hypothetical protein UUU_04420 [Klebsiella pneumoniae subsp. pneumoniae DSM 30104 = JCM 1662 = NBRC 14940]